MILQVVEANAAPYPDLVILSRFCEGSANREVQGEDSYSMVLRTASTQAVAALRITKLGKNMKNG
jgi:hypothetical protein